MVLVADFLSAPFGYYRMSFYRFISTRNSKIACCKPAAPNHTACSCFLVVRKSQQSLKPKAFHKMYPQKE